MLTSKGCPAYYSLRSLLDGRDPQILAGHSHQSRNVLYMTQASFLSYASQDADVARRICAALRAAGLEVWFDQSELRGGDAWDASIRKQIKECALFVPMISDNTNAREEGYLEWARQNGHHGLVFF